MKFGKNVYTETRYTDGYYKINVQRYNNVVQGVTIDTPEDVLCVKSINKVNDLHEMLGSLLRDWDENETTA